MSDLVAISIIALSTFLVGLSVGMWWSYSQWHQSKIRAAYAAIAAAIGDDEQHGADWRIEAEADRRADP